MENDLCSVYHAGVPEKTFGGRCEGEGRSRNVRSSMIREKVNGGPREALGTG